MYLNPFLLAIGIYLIIGRQSGVIQAHIQGGPEGSEEPPQDLEFRSAYDSRPTLEF